MADEPDRLENDDLLEDYRERERKALARCPNCGSMNVRRAHREGLWDSFIGAFGVGTYRCRDCRNRFHARRVIMEP
jgi:ribosomal protein L37AE/L43A